MKFLTSTVGKKLIMGISGVALFLFIIVHMTGNLNQLRGPEAMNGYAYSLQRLGAALWVARGGLIVMVLLHIWAAAALTLDNNAARKDSYVKDKQPGTSYASRTMVWSGIIVLAFLVYHLLHFTFGGVDPASFGLQDTLGRHDVYTMVLRGFQNPIVSVSYMIAVGLLCWHLSHGVAAFFRSLGLMSKRWRKVEEQFSVVSAVVIFLGFIAVPVGVLMGWVQ